MAIKTGDRGAAVRTLQQQLKASGFNPGKADGVFGKKTAEAVRKFQAAKGLSTDAKVGKGTERALATSRHRDTFEPAPTAAASGTARKGALPYKEMKRFAESNGFTVTSTTGGRHLGKAHKAGRAVDVRTKDHTKAQVDAFIRQARAQGYKVIDERRGGNAAWSGAHIHLQK
jgi:peptidoglycan hydrolase-like protein with peptidoglycan-binding domain